MITVIDRARCSDTADWTRVSSYSPQKILSFNLQSFLSEQKDIRKSGATGSPRTTWNI